MKRVSLFIFFSALLQPVFGQLFGGESLLFHGKPTRWEVNRKEFTSGDSLFFTLHIRSRNRLYYYKDPAWYKLFRVDNDKKIPLEDTAKKGIGEPLKLRKRHRVVVRKLVTQPGTYLLRYPVYMKELKGQPILKFAEQRFVIEMKGKKDANAKDLK